MKVTIFEAPPRNFDPATASDRSLALYGLPRRPDPAKEPGLRKLWDRAFARKPIFQKAHLVETTAWHTRPRALPKTNKFSLEGDWAGAVVNVPSLNLSPPEPANMVYAEWKVPAISTKPSEPGTQIVGFWVGLGGWNSGQVLQAGTAATLSGSSVSYWAWTEWFPAGYVIDNLAIQPGDVVSVLVCAPESDHGFVSMMNQSTNVAISVGVADPSGTNPYDGTSVEWIVESIESEEPNFGSVTFQSISAGTQHHTIDLSKAFTVSTVSSGKTLAKGEIISSEDQVEVVWEAAI
ncbi:MAG TPA: G1 family glutamic endopeptidase [Candidatus Binataceae bacterium]|nr:G1 family glutamic endopeptidase [Candidatus Binataceae bacterium]